MNHREVEIPYGKETVRVSVPAANLMGVYSPNDVPALPDVKGEILRAVSQPIQSPPLKDLVRGKKEGCPCRR